MSRIAVTGGLGFIGSNLVANLIERGNQVVILDNSSTGELKFVQEIDSAALSVRVCDIATEPVMGLTKILERCDVVYHLAASADVRTSWKLPQYDIQNNILATANVAQAAKNAGIHEFVFTSTGCVYGDTLVPPTPEDAPFPLQTSLYGASKVAAEGILSTFAIHEIFKVTVFRFVSVLGKNYHHGHVADFVSRLRRNPRKLEILGDGNQRKSYLDVGDCVRALTHLRSSENFEIFNIGSKDTVTVLESAKIIAEKLNLNPEIVTGNEPRGWVGDNPYVLLDTTKANSFGWEYLKSPQESIRDTVSWLISNEWVLEKNDLRNALIL